MPKNVTKIQFQVKKPPWNRLLPFLTNKGTNNILLCVHLCVLRINMLLFYVSYNSDYDHFAHFWFKSHSYSINSNFCNGCGENTVKLETNYKLKLGKRTPFHFCALLARKTKSSRAFPATPAPAVYLRSNISPLHVVTQHALRQGMCRSYKRREISTS